MADSEFRHWLKQASENKISAKNTWKSTLIENFKTEKFADADLLDFNTATNTLDGCVKTYSTRVENVHKSTLGILERLHSNIEDKGESKKKQKKNKANFIEKSHGCLNLKDTKSTCFHDSLFSNLLIDSNKLFLKKTCMAPDGVYRLFEIASSQNIFYGVEEIPVEIDLERIRCSYLIDELGSQKKARAIDNFLDENEHPNQFSDRDNYAEELQGDNFLENFEIEDNFAQAVDVSRSPELLCWAGPNFWKLPSKSKICKHEGIKLRRERSIVDFKKEVDVDKILFSEGSTTLTDKDINDRKKEQNCLPIDYKLQSKDLYKYFYRDEHISISDTVGGGGTLGMTLTDYKEEIYKKSLRVDDLPVDANCVVKSNLAKNIAKNYRRTQKNVDLKVLKQNLFNVIRPSDAETTLSTARNNIRDSYSKEEFAEISPHFFIISLLHIANESNLDINCNNSEVIISK